jgi:hypothetical protein
VSQITGRYLNKAPIDPWGKPYAVASTSGTVYSGGPDRDYGTVEDNIAVPYQPPLALVSAKWADRNNTGAVDTRNASDQILLTFSRKLANAPANFSSLNPLMGISSNGSIDNVASYVAMEASRTLILDVKNVPQNFVPGSDTIQIKSTHATIVDFGGSLCIASQTVVILPQ